ncbi:DUF2207 family protein [Occultella gossypii]|uniref:DUF2207 domain-containing protein n=1 Tax=Occultella gossypii TaxID=2800820 RepID=A0ABS7SCF2_9MICO|nr:DUF2207 domain-containing protein [Occultella gossypii]MBZ2197947.1 DUF2207 domain-containing protein [Occultella gossypii]
MRRRHLFIVGAALAMLVPASSAAAETSDEPHSDDAITVHVDMVLQDDGSLSVTETIRVPEGMQAERDLPLRIPPADDLMRVFTLADMEVTGAGAAEVVVDALHTTAPPGETEVRYVVSGTVADSADEQLATWYPTGWWDTDVAVVTGTFLAATPALSIGYCRAGAPGSTARCTLAAIADGGVLEFEQHDLLGGQRVELGVGLPLRTVPATAEWDEEPTPVRAFAFTTPALVATGALLLLLLGLAAWVVTARRRDLALLAEGTAVDVITDSDGEPVFSVPYGVLPGTLGTLVDASVDPVDLAASTLDLAVRRYLHIEAVGSTAGTIEWTLSRANDPDDQLREFERLLVEGLVPGDGAVDLGEVAEGSNLDLRGVRAAVYGDLVHARWFAGRQSHRIATWAGGALLLAGLAATIALALTVGHALVGVAAMVAGFGVLLAPRYLPLRTAAGSRVAGDLLAMRPHLRSIEAESIPAAERELLFTRALPYALALGESRTWVSKFAAQSLSDDGTPGIEWLGGFENDADLTRFSASFPHLVAELEAAFAARDHRASLGH